MTLKKVKARWIEQMEDKIEEIKETPKVKREEALYGGVVRDEADRHAQY